MLLLVTAARAQSLAPVAAAAVPSIAVLPVQPPFTLEDRWNHYLRRTYSWQRMSLLAADITLDMSLSPGECGRSANCFNDRFAGAFFRRSTRTSIEFVAGALLNEDIRRRRSNRHGFGPRLKYSLSHAFAAYHSDGTAGPAWSRFIGAAGGIAVTSGWSGQAVCGGRMLNSFSWATASNVQDSLLNEFGPDLKRFGLKIGRSLPFVRKN